MKSQSFPAGVSQAGIAVKARLASRAPVLSLRWDTYWKGAKGTGLTWLNRIASEMQMHSPYTVPAEKHCHGTGQGYENTVPGYGSTADLWLRVRSCRRAGWCRCWPGCDR